MNQRLATDNDSTSNLNVVIADVLVGILSFAFFATCAVLLYWKWNNFDPHMLDFSKTALIYEKLVQGVPYEYKMHYYVFFFMGTYPIFLPVYWLFRSIWVIFAIHLLGFSLSLPVLYKISRQVLPGVLLPLVVGLAYVLNPSINMMVLGLSRLESLWMLLFFLVVFYVLKKKYRAALLFSILACFIRVDAAPAIFLLGLMYWFQKKKKFGVGIMVRSVCVVVLVVLATSLFYLISGIVPEAKGAHVVALETESGSFLLNLFLEMADTVTKPSVYSHFVIGLQFLLLPLLAPLYLLPMLFSSFYIIQSHEGFLQIPLVASLLTPGNPVVPYLHIHDSFILPVLFVGMVFGIRNIVSFFEKRMTRDRVKSSFRVGLAAVLAASFFSMHWFFATPELGPIPLTSSFNRDYYRMTPHARFCWKVLSDVPKDKLGIMQYSFMDRAYDYPRASCVYPSTQIKVDTHYALFDLYAFSPNMQKEELLGKIEEILKSGEFAVELFEDGVLYLTRGIPNQANEKAQKFISQNRQWLSQNMTSPYMYGKVPREVALQNVFTETMLPDSDDQ